MSRLTAAFAASISSMVAPGLSISGQGTIDHVVNDFGDSTASKPPTTPIYIASFP